MKKEPLLCIECKYAVATPQILTALARRLRIQTGWRCSHPDSGAPRTVDVVTGLVTKANYDHCMNRRLFAEVCGPKGLQWMPLHSQGLFKLITKDEG